MEGFWDYLTARTAFNRIAFSFLVYAVFAGGAYFIFYVWKKRDWLWRRVQARDPKPGQLRHELAWSALTRLIFGLINIGIGWYVFKDQTLLYYDVAERGWAYAVASFFGLVLFHDAYFYWSHRLMHHKWVYKTVHKVHHHSTNPTPLASFAFHWTETIVEILPFPIIVFFVPMHIGVFLAGLAFQITFNVVGHSGFEIMPRGWTRHPVLKYINTPTHHNMHHHRFNWNYSLYFNWWDRWFGTMHPDYEKLFASIHDKRPA